MAGVLGYAWPGWMGNLPPGAPGFQRRVCRTQFAQRGGGTDTHLQVALFQPDEKLTRAPFGLREVPHVMGKVRRVRSRLPLTASSRGEKGSAGPPCWPKLTIIPRGFRLFRLTLKLAAIPELRNRQTRGPRSRSFSVRIPAKPIMIPGRCRSAFRDDGDHHRSEARLA